MHTVQFYKICDNIVSSKRENYFVLLNATTFQRVNLNFPSNIIWQGLINHASPEGIVECLEKNSVENAKYICNEVIDKLEKLHLIEEDLKYTIKTDTYDYIPEPTRKIYINKGGLVVTDKCNFRCKHCYNTDFYKQDNKIFCLEDWKKTIDKLVEYDCFDFLVTGGETLLCNDIWGILDYLNEKKVAVTLNSNGSLINDENIERLSQYHRLSCVSMSLYGLTKDTYAKMSGIDFDPLELVKTYKKMLNKGIPCELKYVFTTMNYEDSLNIKEFEEKYDIKIKKELVYITPFLSNCKSINYNLNYEQILTLHDKGYIDINSNCNPCKDCNKNTSRCSVNYQGDISLCEFCQDIVIGNLFDNSFNDVWTRENYNAKMEQYHSANNCKECKYKNYCQRCDGISFISNKKFGDCSPALLDFAKNAYEISNLENNLILANE